MPWQGSVSVPFVVAAPSAELRASLNLASNVAVAAPVTTMDIGGTVLDFAGAVAVANMTTLSLRPLLLENGGYNSTPPRPFVSSGLGSWRAVVMTHPANGNALKLVCCRGPCNGQPKVNGSGFVDEDWASRVLPVSSNIMRQVSRQPLDGSDFEAPQWTKLLYDTTSDPFDMTDVSVTYPHAVDIMTQLLPPVWCGSASLSVF